jgi:hypothetical protein
MDSIGLIFFSLSINSTEIGTEINPKTIAALSQKINLNSNLIPRLGVTNPAISMTIITVSPMISAIINRYCHR